MIIRLITSPLGMIKANYIIMDQNNHLDAVGG